MLPCGQNTDRNCHENWLALSLLPQWFVPKPCRIRPENHRNKTNSISRVPRSARKPNVCNVHLRLVIGLQKMLFGGLGTLEHQLSIFHVSCFAKGSFTSSTSASLYGLGVLREFPFQLPQKSQMQPASCLLHQLPFGVQNSPLSADLPLPAPKRQSARRHGTGAPG